MLKELKSKFEKKTKSKIDFGAVKTILKGNRGSSKGVNRGSFSKIFFLHEANKIAAFLLIPWQKNGTAFNLFILQFVQLTSCAGSASCTYDVNNNVVGVTKPDGSVTTTVYDNKQRVTSTVEKTSSGAVISGFEYVYDDLSRITEEKVLANSTKIYYTYDNLGRVTARTIKRLSDQSVLSAETFAYDAAGNLTDAGSSSFQYDTNNRLVAFGGSTVSYDMDGNLLSNGSMSCTYDSANRLITAGGHTYTYNAEEVRIRNLCAEEDTAYTYDTNARLSRLLTKTTGSNVTKYVYGLGLIGEQTGSTFRTYHFDCRGSTVAITDANGIITDTFAYDTYGKLIGRTGTSAVSTIFENVPK